MAHRKRELKNKFDEPYTGYFTQKKWSDILEYTSAIVAIFSHELKRNYILQ